jgi:hypothetical protein
MARKYYNVVCECDCLAAGLVVRKKLDFRIFTEGGDYTNNLAPGIKVKVYRWLMSKNYFPLGDTPACVEIKSVTEKI